MVSSGFQVYFLEKTSVNYNFRLYIEELLTVAAERYWFLNFGSRSIILLVD